MVYNNSVEKWAAYPTLRCPFLVDVWEYKDKTEKSLLHQRHSGTMQMDLLYSFGRIFFHIFYQTCMQVLLHLNFETRGHTCLEHIPTYGPDDKLNIR